MRSPRRQDGRQWIPFGGMLLLIAYSMWKVSVLAAGVS
jgi:hypothetical protein